MREKVIWTKNLSFVNASTNKSSILLSAAPAAGGDDLGYEPMQLVAIALAGCTAMDVLSILRKKRQDITAFEVEVYAERASEFPKVFTNITIEYIVEGNQVEPAAVERSIELSTTKYCPVQAMLSKACKIEQKYSIKNARTTNSELTGG